MRNGVDGSENAFPLSLTQEDIYFDQLHFGENPLYNVGGCIQLGFCDLARLEAAHARLVMRNDVFGIRIRSVDGDVRQEIASQRTTALPLVDLSNQTDPVGAATARLDALFQEPLPLEDAELYRAFVVKLADDHHWYVCMAHHVIMDGWGFANLARTLGEAYHEGEPEQPRSWRDVVGTDRAYVGSPRYEADRSYWLAQCGSVPEKLLSPFYDWRFKSSTRIPSGREVVALDPSEYAAVRELAATIGVGVSQILLGVLVAYFSQIYERERLIVGVPAHNRKDHSDKQMLGAFTSVSPVCVATQDNPSFADLVKALRDTQRRNFRHQRYPIGHLIRDLGLTGRNSSLYDIGFNYLKLNSHFHIAGEQAKLVYWTHFHEATPLILTVWEYGDDLPTELQFDYNSAYFDPAEAARIAQRFLRMLRAVLAGNADSAPLSDLPRLTEDEELALRSSASMALAAQSRETQGVHALFEAQARQAPDAIAVVGQEQTLTYAALNSRANQLARHLRSQGVDGASRVAICLRRSPQLLIATMAVLKAGATYVPLDPDYSSARLEHMLSDCGASVLLTETSANVLSGAKNIRQIFLDATDVIGAIDAQSTRNLDSLPDFTPDRLAYVMYTSGSTGLPKGVMVSHANLKSYYAAVNAHYKVGPGDGILQISSCSFDIFVEEVFVSLLSGGRLVLRPAEIMDGGEAFWRFVQDWKVSVLALATAFWHTLCSGLEPGSPPVDCLRLVSVGGEAMSGAMLKRWRSCFGSGTTVLNSYGPTECTVVATIFDTAQVRAEAGAVSIGHPLQNTRCYVLDTRGRPSPSGVPGELYLAGEGVSQGYLNRPDLTDIAFLPNPFAASPGRLYRTGDLVRQVPDGSLDFLGRADKQLKVRGFRIEPSEVEAALLQRPEVREAFVCGHGEPRELIAYVVLAGEAGRIAELKAHLKKSLPDYMIPAAIVRLESLPSSVNGKIETSRLPAPSREDYIANAYVEPRHDLEIALSQIWADVLKRERVGLEDHFFEIGGSSLIAVELQRAINTRLGKQLKVTDIFAFPTVEDMAARLAGRDEAVPHEAADRSHERRPIAREDIAVVAMACRFPDADSPETFWANLCAGKESIHFFTDEQLRDAGVAQELLGRPNYVKSGFVLDSVHEFDAVFFGFTPREAELLDPQQRLLFECAEEALARGGYGRRSRQNRIGVFVGVGQNRYLFEHILPNRELIDQFGETAVMMANLNDFAATRLSHKLDLRGPSVNVNTACSSSLVAIHMACASLLDGSSDLALAGGASIAMFRPTGVLADEGGIASADGHCRPFDAGADGTRPGSGAGIVAVKRLKDALAEDDVILAVIKGSSINNDGANKVGFTAPSVDGQASVIREALQAGGVHSSAVSYLEAHGTGTKLGDAIEVAALRKVFPTREQPYCAVGSVKSNIGHLDAAAGVAGLMKVVMALRHGKVPAQIQFGRANPEIDLEGSPFFINREPVDWTYASGPRTAGVSSFGIGGTNAHVVLQQPPAYAPRASHRDEQLVLLSARTESALKRYRRRLADYLAGHPQRSLADVAYTLQLGRETLACRFATVANSVEELCQALGDESESPAGLGSGIAPDVVFMLPGVEAAHVGMGRDIYRQEPVFRAVFDRCAELLEPELGLDIRDIVFSDGESVDAARPLEEVRIVEPVMFAIEFSLAKLVRSWGIEPSQMIGHGVGEYVAACTAGVFDLPAALKLVAARARLLHRAWGGAMLSVSCGEDPIRALLAASGCELAAASGKGFCVVAGTVAQIAQLETLLADHSIVAVRLDASHAAQTSRVDALVDEFKAVMATVTRRAPGLPYVSTLGGEIVSPEQACDPSYWAAHFLSAVQLAAGAGKLRLHSGPVFLELGPGSTLGSAVKLCTADARVVATMVGSRGHCSGERSLLSALGDLWLAGVNIDHAALFAGETRRKVVLPAHPFERRRYWLDPPASRVARQEESAPQLFVPTWQREDSASPRVAETQEWLVVDRGCGLGSEIARVLSLHGQRVIVIGHGDRIGVDDLAVRHVDMDDVTDCHRLVESLKHESVQPHRVVIAALSDAHRQPANALAVSGVGSAGEFMAAANIVRAIASASVGTAVRFDVVTRNAQSVTGMETLCADAATLSGLCKVAPQEFPGLEFRQVDLDAAPLCLSQLIDELLSPGPVGVEVAYRGAYRWVKSFSALKAAAQARPSLLRDNGVYVITGGLGNMGLAIAEFLARTYGAKLALIGRAAAERSQAWSDERRSGAVSEADRRKADLLSRLTRIGAQVSILSADVTDAVQMEAAFAGVEQQFGTIHGVIHCAGEVDRSVAGLQEIRREHVDGQFAPKVAGVQVLDQLLLRRDCDFCLLMSSLSSVLGGLGFAAYAGANAFLDAFAHGKRNRGDKRWISMNWDGWNFSKDNDIENDRYRFRMSPEEGVQVFDRALRVGCPAQLVNSNGPLESRIREWVHIAPESPDESAVLMHRPEIAADFVAPRFRLEVDLVSVWQRFLGFQKIGVDDDFFSLGGDSLLLTRVVAEINRRWNVELSIRTAFERSTIAGLAVSLAGLMRVEDERGADDRFVEELL